MFYIGIIIPPGGTFFAEFTLSTAEGLNAGTALSRYSGNPDTGTEFFQD